MEDLLFLQQRADALRVDCPYCAQPAEQLCIHPRTKQPLRHQAAHFVRITAGQKAAATAGSQP